MKIMLVLALMGIFAASNGEQDAVCNCEVKCEMNCEETTVTVDNGQDVLNSYDPMLFADLFEANPEMAAESYPEQYARYLEAKKALEEMPELYEQSETVITETAPMPEIQFADEDLVGYWMDSTDEEEPKIINFYMENGQLVYRYYKVVAGNSIGMNIANEVTEWTYSNGIVNTMPNQGTINCQCGTGEKVYISFYYGFDGTDTMIDQVRGTTFYRVQ